MNSILDIIANRKSIRSYQDREIEKHVKDKIIQAAFRSPTAGNLMLYSMIEVTEQKNKDKYKRRSKEDFINMYEQRHKQIFGKREEIKGTTNVGQYMYQKKYASDYAAEMNRSVDLILKAWFKE